MLKDQFIDLSNNLNLPNVLITKGAVKTYRYIIGERLKAKGGGLDPKKSFHAFLQEVRAIISSKEAVIYNNKGNKSIKKGGLHFPFSKDEKGTDMIVITTVWDRSKPNIGKRKIKRKRRRKPNKGFHNNTAQRGRR